LEFRYIVAVARCLAPTFPGEDPIVRRGDLGFEGTGSMWLWVALAIALSGCGTSSGLLKSDGALRAGLPPAATPVSPAPVAVEETAPLEAAAPDAAPAVGPMPAGDPGTSFAPVPATLSVESDPEAVSPAEDTVDPELLAGPIEDVYDGSALAQSAQDAGDAFEEEYDPWESFNEKMFAFNRGLDRWILKPAARAYMVVMPDPWQGLIANGFDNINFVPRFVNSMLQGKWGGAGRELGRFLINSTAGIGGLFDPAKDFWGIPKSREDFGQTLGVWGSGPGPYLILPLMEPLTVRDGIGKFVDGFMDPLSYVLPFFWTRVGMKAGDTLNDRALNYDLFQGFEESVIDMYSAVRHGYLQRRQQLIKE
jgi:phospholipid-binding lipoprotein MlaA